MVVMVNVLAEPQNIAARSLFPVKPALIKKKSRQTLDILTIPIKGISKT